MRCGADDRQALQQRCRHITRPTWPNERVHTNAAGQVGLTLKIPWRDGTTHMVMSPLKFMQRLAALVPRPRLHLIRFHGVLAPNAKLRAQVVPQEPEPHAQAATPAECEATCAHHRAARLSWGKLLKRVGKIDMTHCPNCGGELTIIVATLEQPVIDKVLSHLGLQAREPPRGPARGHPAASGLTVSIHRHSGGPKPMAAGTGCIQAAGRRGTGSYFTRKRYGAPGEKPTLGLRLAFRRLVSNPGAAQRVSCRGALGKKGAFESAVLQTAILLKFRSCR